mmetsp:Transcript_39711/g.63719  ORF Transcript_39711/g.63719 Transcript_39711/m.63719 type:complete len:208 (+) Transcript_39711:1627-2250(+)
MPVERSFIDLRTPPRNFKLKYCDSITASGCCSTDAAAAAAAVSCSDGKTLKIATPRAGISARKYKEFAPSPSSPLLFFAVSPRASPCSVAASRHIALIRSSPMHSNAPPGRISLGTSAPRLSCTRALFMLVGTSTRTHDTTFQARGLCTAADAPRPSLSAAKKCSGSTDSDSFSSFDLFFDSGSRMYAAAASVCLATIAAPESIRSA